MIMVQSKYTHLKYAFVVGALLTLSLESLQAMTIGEFDETPLGRYRIKSLPTIRNLPQRHILAMSPAKNQGPLGTCVSFAVSACAEYFGRNLGLRFSEGEFTTLAELDLPPSSSGNCRPGLFMGEAFKVAKTYGLTEESSLPYGRYLSNVARMNGISVDELGQLKSPVLCQKGMVLETAYNVTMETMGESLRLHGDKRDIGYTLPGIYPLHHVSRGALETTLSLDNGRYLKEEGSIGIPTFANLDKVKNALARGCPVAAALPVYTRCWDNVSRVDSTVSMPGRRSTVRGHHAVVLTGYDENLRAFSFKNSWGSDWGYDGFAWLPYEYVRKYATELVAVGS